MSVVKVSSLYIYPIKSTTGINISHADVDELGLAFDRRFVISDTAGQVITARTEPTLCLVKTALVEQGITLSAANMPTLTLPYEKFSKQYQNVTVWGDEIFGQLCSNEANAWFSEYLQRPCQLLFFGAKSHRERKPNTDKARKVAFADGYPLLLISQASLDELNQRLADNQQQMVSMTQFRPNIVVENCLPFAEDGWQHVRIGEVEFKVSKPCERCIFTTINPLNGEKHPEKQPLQTLKSFRKNDNHAVLFGQNLIPLNNGQIRAGDQLTIIGKQKPPAFIPDNATNLTQVTPANNAVVTKPVKQKLTLHFKKWYKDYQVNNPSNSQSNNSSNKQKTLLEHGEDAGLILPYSCRAGMCGHCKAKLISGEVKQLSSDGLTSDEKQNGYILCCSAIATTDVVINHE